MTDEIVFYHNPQSRARMVHVMLEEVGAPYRIVPISFEKNEHKSPNFSPSTRWASCRPSPIMAWW